MFRPATYPYPPFRSPRSLVLSGKSAVPATFEWHARENPDYPLFLFHNERGINSITYAQAVQGMRRAARHINSRIPAPECIAVIANAGMFSTR